MASRTAGERQTVGYFCRKAEPLGACLDMDRRFQRSNLTRAVEGKTTQPQTTPQIVRIDHRTTIGFIIYHKSSDRTKFGRYLGEFFFLERFDVGDGSNRDNLLRVNLTNTSHVRSQFPYVVRRLGEATYKGVGPEVVSLDVVKVRRILERGVFPIQIFHPPAFHQFQSDIQHTRIYPRKHMKHKTNLLIFGYP